MKTQATITLDQITAALRTATVAYELDSVADPVMDLLWFIVEQRPDFEYLPKLIAEREKIIRDAAAEFDWEKMTRQFCAIVEGTAHFYGNQDDVGFLATFCKLAIDAAELVQGELMADYLENMVERAVTLSKGNTRLPVTVENDQIRIGRHTVISFNRTLRIPEDGKDYLLPAGLGRLPIFQVADFATKVPSKWLEEGGFFIPLYQKEALFIEFEGASWRPAIVKLAVGGINAITGEALHEKIHAHKQDYVVVPDQKWLDGVNSGEGTVSQFVAMPLGQGFTIEEQLTDETQFGGIQLVAFDGYRGRFPDQDPSGIVLASPHPGSFARAVEMGIASGGKIKQEIAEDTYGAESWDEEQKASILIHIINSDMFEAITGQRPPPSPITAKEYAKMRIPWFDGYDEHARALLPAKPFRAVKAIGEFDKQKAYANKSQSPLEITSDLIQRLKVPTSEERVMSLTERMEASWQAGRYRIAYREACRVLDLDRKNTYALQIRADCNNRLGKYFDAECDASECLAHVKNSAFALNCRAYAKLKLGHIQFALADANAVLTIKPTSKTALEVRTEALLKLQRYPEAIADATKLLEMHPRHLLALRLRAECHRLQGNAVESVLDATNALVLGDSDVFTLCTRAAAFIDSGNPYDARKDAEEALRLEPDNEVAKQLLTKMPRAKKL